MRPARKTSRPGARRLRYCVRLPRAVRRWPPGPPDRASGLSSGRPSRWCSASCRSACSRGGFHADRLRHSGHGRHGERFPGRHRRLRHHQRRPCGCRRSTTPPESTAFWLSMMGGSGADRDGADVLLSDPRLVLQGTFDHLGRGGAGRRSFLLGVAHAGLVRRASRGASGSARFTIIGLVTSLSSLAVAVALAIRGFGVWALVAQMVTTYVVQTLLTVAAAPPKIGLHPVARPRAGDGGHRLAPQLGFSLLRDDRPFARHDPRRTRPRRDGAPGSMSMGMQAGLHAHRAPERRHLSRCSCRPASS